MAERQEFRFEMQYFHDTHSLIALQHGKNHHMDGIFPFQKPNYMYESRQTVLPSSPAALATVITSLKTPPASTPFISLHVTQLRDLGAPSSVGKVRCSHLASWARTKPLVWILERKMVAAVRWLPIFLLTSPDDPYLQDSKTLPAKSKVGFS